MTIGMSERTGKNRPVGIATHVVILPARFILIMQALWDILIRRFSVDHRFDRFDGKTHIHIAPVILFGIIFDGVVTITITLSVTTVTTLEHIEIQPFTVVEPLGRVGTS